MPTDPSAAVHVTDRAAAEAGLALHGIGKKYGRRVVLDAVSHAFAPGLTLLTGPSGAGKSTLLRLIATAERPSRGHISWQGAQLGGGLLSGGARALSAYRRTLGYAPQAVDLPDDLTARAFIGFIAAQKGLDGQAADAQFLALADAVGLYADAGRLIATYSGGMRRRLVFIQALLGAPRVIALDEPTAELDAESAGRVAALIRARAASATIVMTTHLAAELAADAAATLRVEGGTVMPA